MKIGKNNRMLKHLMWEHSLEKADIAKLGMVAHSTVERWLAPIYVRPTRKGTQKILNPTFRNLPDSRLELIKLQLESMGQVVSKR